MSVFARYAEYYDLLYRDKDYYGEVAYVQRILSRYAPQARRLLELGCGTGIHAQLLSERGFDLHGVDLSEEMLMRAKSRSKNGLKFSAGDIRSVRLGKTFDAVISLFHVMSYQTSNDDLRAAFATAKAHLEPGGVFLFDCWYGPAVLTQRPTVRVKVMEGDSIKVTRIAEPLHHRSCNVVDVKYRLFLRDKVSGFISEEEELHKMRYLFSPEVDLYCRDVGLSVVLAQEWMTEEKPGFGTWGVFFVAKA